MYLWSDKLVRGYLWDKRRNLILPKASMSFDQMAEHIEAHFHDKHGYGTKRVLDIMNRVNERLCSIQHNSSKIPIALDNLFYDFSTFLEYCKNATTSRERQPAWDVEDYALASLLRFSSPKFPPW
eukprot:6607178-Karenia_brevis.AAC.1